MKQKTIRKLCLLLLAATVFASNQVLSQTPVITLDLAKPGANVSPLLYGLMTEEINHSYDGGLYAELIRNRIFKDNKTSPEGWSLVQDNPSAKAGIKLMALKIMFLMMNAAMPSTEPFLLLTAYSRKSRWQSGHCQ